MKTAIALALTLFFAILAIYTDSPWSVSLFEFAILTLAALWTLRFAIRPAPLRLHPALIPLAAICLLGALQLLTGTTIGRWDTANALLRSFTYCAAFALALQCGAIPEARARFLQSLVYFGFAFSTCAAIGYLSDPAKIFGVFDPPYPGIFLGPFSNKDHYASFIQLLLPIALYEALTSKRLLILNAVIAAIMFSSVIQGASRAGSFLVVAETLLILFLAHRRKPAATRGVIRGFFIPLAAIAALTLSIGWARLWERAQESDPYQSRRQILMSCFDMVRAKPLTGFGLGTFESAYPRFARFDEGELLTHAHNDWVESAVEGGIPLTLLFLAAALLSAPALWRSIWGIGVLSVLTHSLIDFPMHRPAIALWLYVLAGFACGARFTKALPADHSR